MHDAVILHKNKPDVWMADGLQMKLMLAVTCLGGFGAQKFPARGQIEKKRAHLDLRSRRVAAVTHVFDASATDLHMRASQRAMLARGQNKPRHAGDARQRLAAKT